MFFFLPNRIFRSVKLSKVISRDTLCMKGYFQGAQTRKRAYVNVPCNSTQKSTEKLPQTFKKNEGDSQKKGRRMREWMRGVIRRWYITLSIAPKQNKIEKMRGTAQQRGRKRGSARELAARRCQKGSPFVDRQRVPFMNSLQWVNIPVSQLGRCVRRHDVSSTHSSYACRATALSEANRPLFPQDIRSTLKREASMFRDPTVSELAVHFISVWGDTQNQTRQITLHSLYNLIAKAVQFGNMFGNIFVGVIGMYQGPV